MSRRRAVVLYSAFALLGLGTLAGLALVGTLQTGYGREQIRTLVEERLLAPRVKGRVRIWGIASLSFGGATLDSVEIRGPDDSVFVRTGRITVQFNPLDLWDKRTLLTRLEIERPFVHLRRDSTGTWNYRRIFPPDTGPKRPRGPDRGWGDYIVADSVDVRDGAFVLTMPWEPADSLRGVRRDSAIAYNLRREDVEIRRAGNGFAKTRRWTDIDLASGYVRLADPDSAGRLFHLARLDANESDPPFSFRNVRGSVRHLGDSIWIEVKHFDLPGSTGKGSGKVVWGSDLPTRYDIRVFGDSVSLADVAWVYPTLPRTGGGSMVLDIRNEPGDLSVIDYAISDMDVRTTRSRLRGDMTFGVGAPLLIVKDVSLEAAPVNFDLLRALAGGPFAYDWQGDLIGTVRGRGGPLHRFRVDAADIEFRDANVPGAVTRATARGELDIVDPAFTTFRGFGVDVDRLDLRTLQHLNPDFPRVGGVVAGTATLDSVWVDVRFRNADLTHRDGDGPPTRATGSGRVTLGDTFTAYDLALTALPLSFTTLGRSYPALPLRGAYEGPVRIQGTIDDLLVTTELTGPAGTFSWDGRVDAFPRQYAARGRLTATGLDVRTLLANDSLPATTLTGRAQLDVTVDSAARDSALASLAGAVTVDLDRSVVDSLRVFPSYAHVIFGGGLARVDSLRLETVAATVNARGGLGLTRTVSDSLTFEVRVDSLGGVRRYIGMPVASTAGDGDEPPTDSLGGDLRVEGVARGSVDSLAVGGTISARDIWIRGDRARIASGTFAFTDVTDSLAGTLTVRADTASVSGVSIASATVEAYVRDRRNADVTLRALSTTGSGIVAHGRGTIVGDTTIVAIDTLDFSVRDHRLSLDRPTRLVVHPDGVVIDSLRLRDASVGWLSVVGSVPTTQPVALSVEADSLELGDVGELVQAKVPFGGTASLRMQIDGTRTNPRITLTGALTAPRFGQVSLDRATLGGQYADRRLETDIDLFRGQRSALSINASIPVDLALASVPRRMLSEPLRGTIRSDSVELAIVEAFTTSVRDATGKFTANLDIGGVWPQPRLTGRVMVVDGALQLTPMGNVRLLGMNADLAFAGDSIQIERFSVLTRDERTGNLALSGHVNIADLERPRFNLVLGARDFHIVDRPRLAELDVSANLRLVGSYDASTLTGAVTVDRGSVFIPELVTKEVISLDDPDLYNIVDTTLTMNRTLLPQPPPELARNLSVENVQVQMGDDVWLRSAEANINLGGAVGVTVPRTQQGRPLDQLALEGVLTTNRGTYRLNLGIVQRTFQVEPGGTIQFIGEPDFNPVLNINALHTVPRLSIATASEQDIRIRVMIRGTLAQPRIDLESADSLLRISRTDLVSYLVTGAPNFDIGAQGSLATSLLSSLGAYLGDWLRSAIGVVDVVQFEFGRQGVAAGPGTRNSIFSGARLGVGTQIGDRTFVSASAGLCQVWSVLGGGNAGGASPNVYDLLGAKVDYRLQANLGLSASYEPGTSAQFCDAGGGVRGFTFAPRQLGFDIFRTWRF